MTKITTLLCLLLMVDSLTVAMVRTNSLQSGPTVLVAIGPCDLQLNVVSCEHCYQWLLIFPGVGGNVIIHVMTILAGDVQTNRKTYTAITGSPQGIDYEIP